MYYRTNQIDQLLLYLDAFWTKRMVPYRTDVLHLPIIFKLAERAFLIGVSGPFLQTPETAKTPETPGKISRQGLPGPGYIS